MLIHSKIAESTVNGPGKRAVIWFQGCTLNCPGCINESTYPFDISYAIPFSALQTWVCNLLADIEGITFSGGEPMQHCHDVIGIMVYASLMRPHLSYGMFTGYTLRELELDLWQTVNSDCSALEPGTKALWDIVKQRLDFAIMGRFNASLVTFDKPLCGSSNQTITLFSNHYTLNDFKVQQFEITISENATGEMSAQCTGFPGSELITSIKTAL